MSDQQWLNFKGTKGPGLGKHIVLVGGDEEYRSEEALPMMAKILSMHHGFDCTVLFAIDPETGEIDPEHQTNIPCLEALDTADLMLIFTRFRELPDEQMKHIVDYIDSGRPIMGLRTATHAFQYSRDTNGPYAKYDCENKVFEGGFGRQVLGETWVAHHGHHAFESTRGLINPASTNHPILKGVKDVWGTTDVYAVTELTGDPQVLLDGQVLTGMNHDDDPKPDTVTMPVAWIKEYTGEAGKASRVFCTTMGAATDLLSADLRRLLINAAYWGMEMEDSIDSGSSVEVLGAYEPTKFGFGTHIKGLRVEDYA
jgi:type 1 glutamine amidotransferase